MKPKTKLQAEVVRLSSQLLPINRDQERYAFEKCFGKYVIRSRKTLYCLECGHSWKDTAVLVTALAGCTCPECKTDLELNQGYNRFLHIGRYFSIVDTKEDMQVVRMFVVWKNCKKFRKPDFYCMEVMQHWIDDKGKMTTLSIGTNTMTSCYDAWLYGTKLEPRMLTYTHQLRINLVPDEVYPEMNILPIFKRNGIKNSFHDIAPHALCLKVLNDQKAETLLKVGQFDLLRFHCVKGLGFSQWNSVKICIRRKYKVKDASMWIDYLNLLERFRKDTLNPFYVCPKNLKKAHDVLMKKKQAIEKKEQDERNAREHARMIQRNEKYQQAYVEQKAKFIGLHFEEGEISVQVLKNVEDFMEEGAQLGHCVFTNEYFAKPESLILSAQVNKQRMETVEISLDKLQVVQCRGRHNQPSEYHDKIVELVNNNLHRIAKVI